MINTNKIYGTYTACVLLFSLSNIENRQTLNHILSTVSNSSGPVLTRSEKNPVFLVLTIVFKYALHRNASYVFVVYRRLNTSQQPIKSGFVRFKFMLQMPLQPVRRLGTDLYSQPRCTCLLKQTCYKSTSCSNKHGMSTSLVQVVPTTCYRSANQQVVTNLT